MLDHVRPTLTHIPSGTPPPRPNGCSFHAKLLALHVLENRCKKRKDAPLAKVVASGCCQCAVRTQLSGIVLPCDRLAWALQTLAREVGTAAQHVRSKVLARARCVWRLLPGLQAWSMRKDPKHPQTPATQTQEPHPRPPKPFVKLQARLNARDSSTPAPPGVLQSEPEPTQPARRIGRGQRLHEIACLAPVAGRAVASCHESSLRQSHGVSLRRWEVLARADIRRWTFSACPSKAPSWKQSRQAKCRPRRKHARESPAGDKRRCSKEGRQWKRNGWRAPRESTRQRSDHPLNTEDAG